MTHVHISGISGITVVRVELYFNVSKKKIKGRGSDTSLTSTLTDDHETESRLLMEKYIFSFFFCSTLTSSSLLMEF